MTDNNSHKLALNESFERVAKVAEEREAFNEAMASELPVTQERKYLLQKRGLYYRPDSCGYTGIKEHAGRYLASDASLPDVTAIHEDEAQDYSPSCFEDLARQHLQAKLDDANTTIERLRATISALKARGLEMRGINT